MWRALALCLGVLVTLGCASAASGGTAGRSAPAPTAAAVQNRPALDPPSGLAVVHVADLPPEAARTLALIERGGPFPHRQDGETFQNREGLLPSRRAGYYKEYTVDTPGSADRGARRIVAGAGGERYWTDDHYDSFAWIAP
jgi:ribonuclease T1